MCSLIKNISKNDFGVYQCFAVNPHNISKAELELKGNQTTATVITSSMINRVYSFVEIHLRRASTTKTAVSRILIYNGDQKSNELNGPRINTKMSIQSKQQRKTNSSIKLNKMMDREDNDYFENDLTESS